MTYERRFDLLLKCDSKQVNKVGKQNTLNLILNYYQLLRLLNTNHLLDLLKRARVLEGHGVTRDVCQQLEDKIPRGAVSF